MDFREDDRGQPVLIGALLLFAFLVIAFSSYQGLVVPSQNAGVEFDHSQQVQDELVDLRVSIMQAAFSGSGTSTSVQLGTDYPTRIIAINPSPASGSLSTTDAQPITVEGNEFEGSICPDGELDGDATRHFVYRPSYHEYYDAPTTVYENTFAYNQFSNGDTRELLLTNQQLVDFDDNVVELVALEGSVSVAGDRRTSIDFTPGVPRSESVSEPVITLPTNVENEAFWTETVLNGSADDVELEPGESVTITLQGTYTVRCTPVGVNRSPVSGAAGIERPTGLTSIWVEDITTNNNQNQEFFFTLDGELPEGETVEIDLSDPVSGGVDYESADSIGGISGSGEAEYNATEEAIIYTAGSSDTDGTEINFTVEGIDGRSADEGIYRVIFSRSDMRGSETARFRVQ